MNSRSDRDPDAADTARPASGGDFLARLRGWFEAAIEMPPAARAAWIAANVADPDDRAALLRLLALDDAASGFFETPATEHVAGLDADDGDDPIRAEGLVGTKVGAFRLVRLLGKGGMAAVFLGEREGGDFAQRAAIKLLRRGLYSEVEQRLFQRERRVLATLAHPNIAHLIDGGVTEAGIPYLVMEYVDGVPVTRYATEHTLGVRERVALVLTICRSVEAAHRSLNVHRDIKPSNILVTADGTVKLLDFGIAKLVEDEGEAPTVAAFTPEYAAPEQLAGKAVTTATDVYALGLLFCELLLGARPGMPPSHRPSARAAAASPAAAAPPRALQRALRGDLDNIVLRALDADPARRYASAGALADDIERHLAGRPVEAHPPSRWYRARKFVQRHRGAVAVTAALVLGILSALGVALWQASVAWRQEQAARHEAQRANAVRDFIEKLFEPIREGVAQDRQPALSDLVSAGVERLRATADLGAAERVDLTMMFSRLQSELGERERALALAEAADDLARATLDPLDPNAIAALSLRGVRYVRDGDDARGEPLLLEAKRRLAAAGLGGPTLLGVLDNLAVVEMDRNNEETALALSRQALDERRRLYGEDGKETATGYNNLGYGLTGLGRFEAAADAYRRAYAIDIRFRDPGSYDVLTGLSNWGWAEVRSGRSRDGRERLAAVDEGLVKLGGKPRGLHVLNSQKLCSVDLQVASPPVGERDCGRALDLAEAVAGKDSRSLAFSRVLEASRLVSLGDLAHASALLDRAFAAYPDTDQYVRERGIVFAVRTEMAWLRGDAAAARDFAMKARPLIALQKDMRTMSVRLDALLLLACAHAPSPGCPETLARDVDAALAGLRDSIDTRLVVPRLVSARLRLDRGDANGALTLLDLALARARANLDDDHPLVATTHVWRAIALDRAGACADAARERTAAAAATAQSAEPWFAQARAELARRSTCPRSP